MDRLAQIPERVFSYQNSKAEERMRLRVQRIVSIPKRVLHILKDNSVFALPYLRFYEKIGKHVRESFGWLINCNRLTNFYQSPITEESVNWFQLRNRYFVQLVGEFALLQSNECEWEYRDGSLTLSLAHFVIDGQASSVAWRYHHLSNPSLLERKFSFLINLKERRLLCQNQSSMKGTNHLSFSCLCLFTVSHSYKSRGNYGRRILGQLLMVLRNMPISSSLSWKQEQFSLQRRDWRFGSFLKRSAYCKVSFAN